VGRLGLVGLLAVLVLPAGQAWAARRTDGSSPAPALISQRVTSVPARTLNEVGAGRIAGPQEFSVFKLHSHFTSGGKPELLTANLAWCPHCAANSWGLAIALSRFGTLHGLRVINTGTHYCKLTRLCAVNKVPCFPFTHGLSFFGTSYRSRYLSFVAIMFQDLQGHNIERPTRRENAAMNQFDPQGQTPAVDIGGAFGFVNSAYDPGALAHKTWSQIAGSLANAHNRIARHIDGLANLFSAAICKVTKDRPAAVCKSTGVRAAGAALLHAGPPPPPGPGPP
jgi:hypothetical protein